MADRLETTVDSLFKGMENFITTKTVVGEAITVGDTVILPLVDVSFGMAATGKNEDRKNNGGGGMGGKISPSAVLVIHNGATRLVSVKATDSVSKIIDMVPDVVNKFMPGKAVKMDAEVKAACQEAAAKKETFKE